jgi:acyl dehydratase
MKAPAAQQMIQNRTFDEIQVGDFAQLVRTLRPEDIHLFAAMSGDVNPTHVDLEYARSSQFREVVGHSMWGSTLISTVLGTEFPGPGTVYVSQGLNFWRPITIGDTLTITVTCKEKFEHNHHIIFDCLAVNQDGLKVIDGIAEVMAPTEKISRARVVLPEVTVSDRELRYRHLLSVSAGLSPIPIAVAHPCDRESLLGPVQAARAGLVEPILHPTDHAALRSQAIRQAQSDLVLGSGPDRAVLPGGAGGGGDRPEAACVAGHAHLGPGQVVVGLLSLGKSDFEAIEPFRGDRFFKEALGLPRCPAACGCASGSMPGGRAARADRRAEPAPARAHRGADHGATRATSAPTWTPS